MTRCRSQRHHLKVGAWAGFWFPVKAFVHRPFRSCAKLYSVKKQYAHALQFLRAPTPPPFEIVAEALTVTKAGPELFTLEAAYHSVTLSLQSSITKLQRHFLLGPSTSSSPLTLGTSSENKLVNHSPVCIQNLHAHFVLKSVKLVNRPICSQTTRVAKTEGYNPLLIYHMP